MLVEFIYWMIRDACVIPLAKHSIQKRHVANQVRKMDKSRFLTHYLWLLTEAT